MRPDQQHLKPDYEKIVHQGVRGMGCRSPWVILLTFILVLLIASCGVAGHKSPATTSGMIVGCTDMWCKAYDLSVGFTPTSSAQADKLYTVDLYEKGNFRSSDTISWNQLELNVHTGKSARFPLTKAEGNAYLYHDMSNIFSVKVH